MNPWASRLKFGIPFKVLQRERRTRLNAGSDWGINSCWCGWASSCRSSPTYILRSSPLSEPYLSHNVQTHMLQLSWCDHMPEECNSSRFFSLSLSLTSSISFCPRSHLCLSSCKSPSFLLHRCSLLPFITFFFLYFVTSPLPIWTQIGGKLGKTQTEAKQKQTYCQRIKLRKIIVFQIRQCDFEQLFPRAVGHPF